MKKHLSVFGVIARHSLYPGILLMVLMAVSQVALFYINGAAAEPAFYKALDQIPFFGIHVSAMVLLYILLTRALCDKGGRLNNLLGRLYVSEKVIYVWQSVYNLLMLVLFCLVQGLVFVLLGYLYTLENPGLDPMSIFIAAYIDPNFHIFFPLDNLAVIICNGIMLVGLAVCSASYSFSQRRRKFSIKTILMLIAWIAYVFLIGEEPLGSGIPMFFCFVAAIMIAMSALTVGMTEVEDDEMD